jgi:tetratricopeptide (TPR) repeat protein
MPRSRARFWLLLVLLVSAGVHAPSIAGGFALDDVFAAKAAVGPAAVQGNPMVGEDTPLLEFFRRHYWHRVFPTGDLYRPVTVLSYALVYHGLGEPLPQHLVNVLLHAFATFLVYRLVRRFAARLPSLLGALSFGVLGIHSEAVSGVVGRAELLAFCFGAAGVLLGRRTRLLPLAAVLFFLAACSKESGVVWPAFLLVVPGNRRRPALAAGVAALVPYFWLRAAAIAEPSVHHFVAHGANPLWHLPALERIGNGVMLWTVGLGKTLLPWNLCSQYGPAVFTLATTPLDPRVLGAFVLEVMLLALGIAMRRQAPLLFLATAALFGFSFVTSNVPFGTGTILAERTWYLPSLAVAYAVGHWTRALRPRWLLLLVPWWLWHAVVCVERSFAWRDDATLFATDLQRQPRSIMLLCFAARQDSVANRTEAAREKLRLAAQLEPRDPTAWVQLAASLLDGGSVDEAERCVRTGLAADWYVELQIGHRAHGTLGGVLRQRGKLDEAWPHLQRSVNLPIEPTSAAILNDWLEVAYGRASNQEIERILGYGNTVFPRPAVGFHWGRYLRHRAEQAKAQDDARLAAECLQRAELAYADSFEQGGLLGSGFGLAEVYELAGKKELARRLWERLSADPNVPADVRGECRRRMEALR